MKYKDILTYARLLRKNPTQAESLFWEKTRNRQLFGLQTMKYLIIGNKYVKQSDHT